MMMNNVYDVLAERGFIYQVTDEEGLREALERPLTLYVGYDPTGPSLQVGNLATIMLLVHMQRHGHRVITLVGGGTSMVGDPSGKTEARPILTAEEIAANQELIRRQLSRFLNYGEGRALMLNNADWLASLNYIGFLRDIGRHFSVNEMLAAETYRQRLQTGLSFLEFNYRLLQAYDFLYLYRNYDCILQAGGSDQWGNITAGVDLIRREEGVRAFGLVIPLITTASGAKMGKTELGTIYLSPERTSPYQLYQFWINTEDDDVERFLAVFTLLPMEEVRRLGALKGAEIRKAKEVLAYEVTRLVHGERAAQEARSASRALFGPGHLKEVAAEAMPTTGIPASRLEAGIPVVELFAEVGLTRSRSEARRLLQQAGVYVNEERVDDVNALVTTADVQDGTILLRAGKKRYHRVVVA
jgi:tyrosyl-tRNA synthetase